MDKPSPPTPASRACVVRGYNISRTRSVRGTLPGQPTKSVDIHPDDDTDDLAAARGIVAGLLLSIPVWAIIGLGIWYIF